MCSICVSEDSDADHCPAFNTKRDKCVALDCAGGHRCDDDVQKLGVNDAGARWGCAIRPKRAQALVIVHISYYCIIIRQLLDEI